VAVLGHRVTYAVGVMTDDKELKRAELAAMNRNEGRFGIEHDSARNLSRVVDLSAQPHTALTDWMEHNAALAVRDDYFTGRRTPRRGRLTRRASQQPFASLRPFG
jgi:hypothetical protein